MVPRVRISVVIPALNEAGDVENAIRSAAGPGVEVVVVDGGSEDPTVARAEAAGARVVRSPPGRARQLERGRLAATGEAVLFLHADSRLPEGFAAAVRTALADPRVVGGAFGLRFDGSAPLLRVLEWGVRLRVRLFRLPYGDQGIFARRAALEALGGVPQAAIMEDLDLVRGLQRRGRFANLTLPTVTSARRYASRGVLRTLFRNQLASLAWALGVDRARVAAWYRQ
ncbi:MAG: TIGR04283 family arsenosugar biosynthesis glycosyltransferase [Deltaproteobacteria bacterium]|nr:MAG: TIGR04283 family arsenosugar biosynthesis glycosyltransferase [Deltaproteobacteria bacterium]